MSVSNYMNWGNWALFLLWINARLGPAGEELGSAPSPSPLLMNEVPQYDTAPDDSKIKQKTQTTSYTIKQCSTISAGRAAQKPAQGQTRIWRWDADQKHNNTTSFTANSLLVASAVQPLSSNCFTPFNKCWQMQKSEVCTGSKSRVIIPPRFF